MRNSDSRPRNSTCPMYYSCLNNAAFPNWRVKVYRTQPKLRIWVNGFHLRLGALSANLRWGILIEDSSVICLGCRHCTFDKKLGINVLKIWIHIEMRAWTAGEKALLSIRNHHLAPSFRMRKFLFQSIMGNQLYYTLALCAFIALTRKCPEEKFHTLLSNAFRVNRECFLCGQKWSSIWPKMHCKKCIIGLVINALRVLPVFSLRFISVNVM
jgi:hypothetical protein